MFHFFNQLDGQVIKGNYKSKSIFDRVIYPDSIHFLHVIIKQDEIRNLYIYIYSENEYLEAAEGIGNSELIIDDVLIPVNLNSDTIPEYIIGTYTYGSTYGAMHYFIIWYYKNDWYITKTIFQRPIFMDVDEDGITEVVENFNSSNDNGGVYNFDLGSFTPHIYNKD